MYFLTLSSITGTAYTFLQPDQARYAGDLITALEVSEVRVPSDLDKLWKDYVAEQQEAGLKVEKNKGFSGKGYKFNEEEAMMHDERKQLQKFQLGTYRDVVLLNFVVFRSITIT